MAAMVLGWARNSLRRAGGRAGRPCRPGSGAGAGLDALLEVGVVQQPELAIVDQLVFLTLAQRLDGEPELLLRLVHRTVVEVGDPGVDPQNRLCDGEFVLARLQFIVDESARQVGLADMAGRQGDLGLAVLVLPLLCAGAELVDVGLKVGRGGLDCGEVGTGEGEEGTGGLGGDLAVVAGAGVQQGILTEVAAVREHRDGKLSAVLALGSLTDSTMGDQVDPVCGAATLDENFTRREVALRAAIGEGREDVRVLESTQ